MLGTRLVPPGHRRQPGRAVDDSKLLEYNEDMVRVVLRGGLGLLLAGAIAGCGSPAGEIARWWKAPAVGGRSHADAGSSSPYPPPQAVDATIPPSDVGSAVGSDGGASVDGSDSSYDSMCAQYCQSLVDTLFYSCLDAKGSADAKGCEDDAGMPDLCVRARCVPHQVTLATCLTQCDALSRFYGSVCSTTATPGGPECPLSPAEHDRACRAHCVL